MVEFKLNIAEPKSGKCYQKAVAEPATENLIGFKIGDKVKGDDFELSGYEFEITGGSDFCGFPMRKGISGTRKRLLAEKGVGFRKHIKGIKKRKTVCGQTITDKIVQINLKIIKAGKKPLGEEKKEAKEEIKKAEAKPKEKKEVKTEKKKEAKEIKKEAKEEVKKETKPEEKKEAKEIKKEAKEEVKKETKPEEKKEAKEEKKKE